MTYLCELPAPDLRKAIHVCIQARRPVMLHGEPGIGKSDNVRQIVESMQGLIIDLRASQMDPTDGKGVPFVQEGRTRWAIPDFLPSPELAAQYPIVVIFLDELNSAPLMVQAALYQLVLDRQLGDYVLPDNVHIIAAGNLQSDRAVTNRMSTALADRFFHLKLGVENASWENWALGFEGLDQEKLEIIDPIASLPLHLAVIGYLRLRPEDLHQFDPKSGELSFPTPRGYQYVSDVLKVCEATGVNGAIESALLAAKLGESAGGGLAGFLNIFRDAPSPLEILKDPAGFEIPDRPDLNWALSGALAQRATLDNFADIMVYANRVGASSKAGKEYEVLMVEGSVARNPELRETKEYCDWAIRFGNDIIFSD